MNVRTTRSLGRMLPALAAILALSSGAAAFARPAPAAVHKPVVISGHRPGPVDIQGGNHPATIGTLNLPAGAWWIEAKALVVNTTSDTFAVHVTTCRILAGTDTDFVQVDPLGSGID